MNVFPLTLVRLLVLHLYFIVQTAFNIFDMIGKLLPNWRLWTMLPKSLVYILSIGRIVYFPLFILSVNPPILRNDIVAFLIVSSFAFTNGLCGSMFHFNGLTLKNTLFSYSIDQNTFCNDRSPSNCGFGVVIERLFDDAQCGFMRIVWKGNCIINDGNF